MGLSDKAVDAAKKVADVAQAGVAGAKGKLHTVSLNKKIKGLSGQIGVLVVRQKNGEAGLDAEIDRLIGEVRAADAEIKALHEG